MTGFNFNSSFGSEIKNETSNHTSKMKPFVSINPAGAIIMIVILLVVYFLGLFGNGKVIWTLGFRMKRNYFSIYVLNLAVADFGVIIFEALMLIALLLAPEIFTIHYIFLVSFVLYGASQLLLISISVDRCVAVLFPIWQKSHRPPKLSLAVCVIVWILSVVLITLYFFFSEPFLLFMLIFVLTSYLVMFASTLILLVKMKQLQLKRKKILRLLLLALVCFIVLHLPLMIFSIISFRQTNLTSGEAGEYSKEFRLLLLLSHISIGINSSINPILYFLAGRNKEERFRASMKHALQRIFRNEEDTNEDEMQPDEI